MKTEEPMGDEEPGVHGKNTIRKLRGHKTSSNLLTRKLSKCFGGGSSMGKSFPRFEWQDRRINRTLFTWRAS